MDNKPALNLFESIEPNGTVELEGLGTVNLSHFPYREDLAYGWPDDAVRFHDQALPFDGRKLLYGHTHQLSAAGARPESLNTGWDVVADAQHANPEYANERARLATRHGAIWRTEDFDVPLDELLRRNEARPRADHVPEEYIRSSWKRFHHVMFRPLNPEDPNGNLLKRMIADPYVRVTPVRGESDVFACNFTREAFLEGRWNTRTINARGLFVDKNETVVQRGFEKFFAVDETESTKYDTVVAHGDTSPGSFPVRVERKENGIDLTYERQTFKERDIGSRSARS